MSQYRHTSEIFPENSILDDWCKDLQLFRNKPYTSANMKGLDSTEVNLEHPCKAIANNGAETEMEVEMQVPEEEIEEVNNEGIKTIKKASSGSLNVTLCQASTAASSSDVTKGNHKQEIQSKGLNFDQERTEDVVEEGCMRKSRRKRNKSMIGAEFKELWNRHILLSKLLVEKDKMILDRDEEIKVVRLEYERMRDIVKEMEDVIQSLESKESNSKKEFDFYR